MNKLAFNSFNSRFVIRNYPDIPFDTLETQLRYREQGDDEWIVVKGIAMNNPDTDRVVHTVYINGLTQDTLYEFQLSLPYVAKYLTWRDDPSTSIVVHWHTLKPFKDSYTNGFVSEVLKFKTVPASLNGDSLNFAQVSDTHGGLDTTKIFEDIGKKRNMTGIIHSGDIANGNGGLHSPNTWYNFFDSLNHAVNNDGTIIPILPIMGNHETYSGYSGTHWTELAGNKPNFETGERGDVEWYYVFFPTFLEEGYSVHKFGDYLSVYMLDPISTKLDEGQDVWMADTMQEDTNAHQIMSLHYNPYPGGRRDLDTHYVKDIREIWAPIWEKHKPLVLTGHDHVMCKTVPIKNGRRDDENGTVYIGSGPSGNPWARDGFNPHAKWFLEFVRATTWEYFDFEKIEDSINYREPHELDGTTFTQAEVNHWWHIEIFQNKRIMTAYDLNGNVAHSFEQLV